MYEFLNSEAMEYKLMLWSIILLALEVIYQAKAFVFGKFFLILLILLDEWFYHSAGIFNDLLVKQQVLT